MSVSKHYLNKEKTKFNWRVVVYIPTGEYDRFGKPIKTHHHVGYYPTKSEGEVAERKFWNDFEAGTLELNKDAKFEDVILYFLDFAKNEGKYAKGTICNYEGYLKHHFQMLQYVPVKNLTPALIQKWRRELFTKGASDHIFNGCIKLAKAAFNYAIKLKQISINPFKDIDAITIPPKLRNRFSTGELKKVIDTCEQQFPEYYCLFILATLTGARLGEYSAIRPCNIRNVLKKIFIDKQITRGEEKNRTKENASTRTIDISPKVLKIIEWHVEKYNIADDDLMFRADKGGLMYAKWIERKFEKLLEACGYNKKFCRVHDLRGQYVDILHLCGVPTSYISRQVGHSNTHVTERTYTQILKELSDEAGELVDNKIFGGDEDEEK
mgnify:CR=1 FL=1